MSADPRTLEVYEAHASDYDDRFRSDRPDRYLERFIRVLPKGGAVLDLGCGPGSASAFMREAGLRPDPVDASPAMVAIANARHEIGARIGDFGEIAAEGVYAGVWANFSLLHAPRAELPAILAALRRALVPGGRLHIAMKLGEGEGRDRLGRFYVYVTRDELAGMLAAAGFAIDLAEEGAERGLAGTLDPFIVVQAHA